MMTKEKKIVQIERRAAALKATWNALQESIPMYEALAPFAIPQQYAAMDRVEARLAQLRLQATRLEGWEWE